MKRWIIRSFFIGVLLLCVGQWVASYQYDWSIGYQGRNQWSVECLWGKLHVEWWDASWTYLVERNGWSVHACPAYVTPDSTFIARFDGGHYCLGFLISLERHAMFFNIPLWFPTTISAALLWLVWPLTRPTAKGRAFPVEVEKPIAEKRR